MATESRNPPASQSYDLSEVCTILSDRFRVRRAAFTTFGIGVILFLAALAILLVMARPDVVTLIGFLAWILLLGVFGGAYGFGFARRLSPGPSRLTIDARGFAVVLGHRRTTSFPWKGRAGQFRLSSRNTHLEGIPDFSLVVKPRLIDLLPPYLGIVPITALTREAFDSVLSAARAQGADVISLPTWRFIGLDAPGTAYVFELPAPHPAPNLGQEPPAGWSPRP